MNQIAYNNGYQAGRDARNVWDDKTLIAAHKFVIADKRECFRDDDDYCLGFRHGWINNKLGGKEK